MMFIKNRELHSNSFYINNQEDIFIRTAASKPFKKEIHVPGNETRKIRKTLGFMTINQSHLRSERDALVSIITSKFDLIKNSKKFLSLVSGVDGIGHQIFIFNLYNNLILQILIREKET